MLGAYRLSKMLSSEVVDLACCIPHGGVLVRSCYSCTDTLLGVVGVDSLVRAQNLATQSVFVEVEMELTLEIRWSNIVRHLNAAFHLGCFGLQELLLLQPQLLQRSQCGDFDAESRWYGA